MIAVPKLINAENPEELKLWADKMATWAKQQPQVVLTDATTVTITFPESGRVVTAVVVEV